jgi:hypothetical protein
MYKDITGMVRGGRLLEIYLRNDRSAVVSFVDGAAEFMNYAKRVDFYLHTKRVRYIPIHIPEIHAAGTPTRYCHFEVQSIGMCAWRACQNLRLNSVRM